MATQGVAAVKARHGLAAEFELEYTDRDAQELAKFFTQQDKVLYSGVTVKVVSGGTSAAPTKENILSALELLKQAGPDDTAVLFPASHGVRDTMGNYYFAVTNSRTEDLCAILPDARTEQPAMCPAGTVDKADRSSFMPWQIFHDALGATAGWRLLIVDTCEAGNIKGEADVGSLRKRSASSLDGPDLLRGMALALQGTR